MKYIKLFIACVYALPLVANSTCPVEVKKLSCRIMDIDINNAWQADYLFSLHDAGAVYSFEDGLYQFNLLTESDPEYVTDKKYDDVLSTQFHTYTILNDDQNTCHLQHQWHYVTPGDPLNVIATTTETYEVIKDPWH